MIIDEADLYGKPVSYDQVLYRTDVSEEFQHIEYLCSSHCYSNRVNEVVALDKEGFQSYNTFE